MISLSGAKGRILFVLLAAAWILPGTIGRSPWKADEAYTYGLVHHIADTGDWVVPELGGEPFMQKPPLMFVTAAICGKLFGGLVGTDTAFRLAVVIFQVLTLVALGVAGRELLGQGKGWYVPALFIGCVGFMHLSHMLICDVSLVTGFAVAFAGLVFAGRRAVLGGVLLGTGAGIAFMSKGLIGPGLIGLTALALPFCGRNWRTAPYFGTLVVAAVASLPWVFIWPVALYQRSPELFKQWFLDNNLGRFLGAARVGRPNSLGLGGEREKFYLEVPWFAWPAFPLLCVLFWKEGRAAWKRPGVQLGLVGLVIIVAVLSVSRNSRTLYGLPMLIPACQAGGYGVAHLPSRWAEWVRKSCALVFGSVIVLAWLGWLLQIAGWLPGELEEILHKAVPDYQPVFQWLAFLSALAATVVWVWWMMSQPREDNRTAALNWSAGISLCYLLVMTLFLPLVESNMSYQHLARLRPIMSGINGEVMSSGLGEPQRAMFDYYCGLRTTRLELNPAANDNWWLTQTDARTAEGQQLKGPPWVLKAESVHSRKELFRLYERAPDTGGAATNR